MTMLLPPAWIMVLLHFRVGLSLYVIQNRHYKNKKAPEDYHLLLKVNTLNGHGQANYTYLPKGKPLGSHMVGWIYPIHPYNSTMNG